MRSRAGTAAGVPESKDASWKAANDWWEKEQGIADLPTEDEEVAKAVQVRKLVQDFHKLDEETRRKLVDSLIGEGQYARLDAQAEAVVETVVKATPPDRTIVAQVEAWKNLLRGVCQSGQMSSGRFDAYCRNIRPFVDWIGPESAIDAIDEAKLEGFFNHLSAKVGVEEYSPTYAHTLLMTSRQFIARLAELNLIAPLGNIRSRRFRFNHSVAAKIEVFTPAEVTMLLEGCHGFSERTKLFLLLMLNVGMYQNDIAELRHNEVDWSKGTLSRARSKTRERGGPVVTYKLWPETLALLKKHRSPSGELVLTTDEGNPLVKYWLENGVMRRYDAVQSAWSRLAAKTGGKIRLGMKHLRKTSATILGDHPHFKFYTTHFLADSPKGMSLKHYVVPSDAEFFEALDWLRGRILGPERG